MSSIIRTIDSITKLRVGDYVQFNKDKLGFIIDISNTDTVKIKEVGDDASIRPFRVRTCDCKVIPLAGQDPEKNRNILHSPKPKKNELDVVIESKSDLTCELISVLQESRGWTYGCNDTHPFYKYLQENEEKGKGWIRHRLPSDIEYTAKCLNSDMRAIYVNQYNLLSGFPKSTGSLKNWQTFFYHAWGISKRSSNRIINQYYERCFHPERKERSDKGHTLINSSKKRKSVYNARYVFKREQTQRRFRDFTHRLINEELNAEFESKPPEEVERYSNIAESFFLQGQSLHHDIIEALQNTCGNVSYKMLANHIGGIATENTIAKHLKSLDGFSVVKNRILPSLSRHHREKRKQFCKCFFVFWISAKCLSPKVKLIKTHMDEKWVQAITIRRNIKILASYHIDRRTFYAPHKNYLDQVMFIVINGFIPKDNDLLGNGGKSIKVACIPVGDMMECKRAGYKRVYDDEGNYTNPAIPGNETKIVGNFYWENKTLCAHNKPKKKQFSLIHAYRDTIIPAMENIARKESENGRYDVIFYEQEDCAGVHNSDVYIEWKNKEFNRRKWLRRNQSPQSPLFNVNDQFYFRKLSKEISSMQSLTMGTRLMKSEEIIKIVDKVWKDNTDSVSISRGWMSHYQVIAAALEMDGDNAYLKNKGGLDFGVRLSFHANADNTGVDKIEEPVDDASAAEVVANERIKTGLKYEIPNIEDLRGVRMTNAEKEFFREYLDDEKLTDDVLEFWLPED